MRITSKNIELAKQDLLKRLDRIPTQDPDGLRTNQLKGTKHFHGARTLTNAQIIRVLRAMPDKVSEMTDEGRKRPLYWTLSGY